LRRVAVVLQHTHDLTQIKFVRLPVCQLARLSTYSNVPACTPCTSRVPRRRNQDVSNALWPPGMRSARKRRRIFWRCLRRYELLLRYQSCWDQVWHLPSQLSHLTTSA
jgi:hypothetical protein